MHHEKKVPTSHLGRFARVAAAGARIGAGHLLGKDSTNPAAKAAELLGTLRGVASKLGQMASYVDGMVPEEHRDAYEAGMRGLLAAAPRSSTVDIRRAVENGLKGPIDRLFVEWDDVPIASASVGQVHRARMEDGREVAVKVQHPGIVQAMESDLDNIGLLEGMVALGGGRKLDSKRLFDEAAARLREELDYGLEARRQERFRQLHHGDHQIKVPAVIQERSTGSILTTEFVRGMRFDQATSQDSTLREAWCEALWRFVYKGNMLGGLFNADPHPGNYFFHDDGTVTFLDFGCVQEIEEVKRQQGIAVHRAARNQDEAAFKAAARAMMDLRGGGHEERTLRQLRDIYAPLFHSPYHITRAYSSHLLQQMRELGAEARKGSHDDHYVGLPKGFLFMNRLQFGFYSILARMDVEVDYAKVERAFMGE